MFGRAEKENNPLSGGWLIFLRRFFNMKKKTIFTVLCVVLGFWFLVSILFEQADMVQTNNQLDNQNQKDENDRTQVQQLQQNLMQREEQLREWENRLAALQSQISQQLSALNEKKQQFEELTKQKLDQQPLELPSIPKAPAKPASGFGADLEKQAAVKEAFLFAWNGYTTHVWGTDELHPVSGTSQNWLGLGLTIIDSLDTLWIMDLKDEFKRGRDWVAESLHFNKNTYISFFETTIRVLGGLLSAYDLSGDSVFLTKAKDLGTRFLPVFDTPSGIPYCSVNLETGGVQNPSWTGGASILSEVGTVQLEFVYLSKKTGDSRFAEKALKVYDTLDKARKHSGLYSVYVSPQTGEFTREHITLGALGDSFYEYLLKLWLLKGKNDPQYRRMYDEAMDNVVKHLVKKSSPNELTYIAELIGGRIENKMDHLVCFAGAMFALGSLDSINAERDMLIGSELTKTCYEMYHRMATGISPEIVRFEGDNDFIAPHGAKHYLLRPEAAESMFVLWRLTHDPIFRTMGWEMFQAINKYCRAQYGFSGIRDVTTTSVSFDNLQQSFFLAETLKYFYLLFSDDDLIPLDKYVFNTEAHPLSVLS